MGDDSEADIILRLARELGALRSGEFKLSGGRTSRYYFDGRLVTLDPEGAYHVARAILPILRECGAEAIAGPTVGADPIVAAVAVVGHLEGLRISGLIVRKQAKEHGAMRAIEGPVRSGARVAVVDDTCTTGASLLHAIAAVEAAGCRVVKVIAVLDRREGGSQEIRSRGYDFVALLEADGQGQVTAAGGAS